MYRLLLLFSIVFGCHNNTEKNAATIAKRDSSKNASPVAKDISDPTNTLTGKEETLDLNYLIWGCACANWITQSDNKKYKGSQKYCIFIEPSNDTLAVPKHFDPAKHYIRVSGQFYVKPDYPKGTFQGEEDLKPAKVFRYTKLSVKEKQY